MAYYYEDENGNLKKKDEKVKYKYIEDDKGNLVRIVDTNTSKDRTWFKKGAFEDGYQFGDLMTSVGDTIGDVGLGVLQGAGNMVEGITDLGMYGVAGVSNLVGADSFADDVKNIAKKNTVDDLAKSVRDLALPNSFLGERSVDVANGLGQVATTLLTAGAGQAAGLGSAGVSVLSSGAMFTSSAGAGMSEAYQSGASDEDALKYGLLKGAVDAGSELVFGGLGKTVKGLGISKGISSLDDVFAKKLSDKISNQALKTLIQYGVKTTGEGVEEVLAGLGSAVAKKLTYMPDAELKQLIKDEKLIDQFVVGAITSGIVQGGDAIRSVRRGTDFVTGMTKNEELVVEKEAQNRIAERKKEGKLSNREKDKIYEQVRNDLAKGYISIDTIESALGGDTYKNYVSVTERESALQKEYDTLNKMKQGDMTGEQSDRRVELKQQLEELKRNATGSKLKEQLSREVAELAKRDRLNESYNEKTRRSQTFTADMSKYDAKQQETIKRAAESGILNNTNRTHEFVDMLAKISADKGVSFDFTNNQKLKESGFALEGKTVNGFLKNGSVTLNIESAKALNVVVGHEITHVLEGTELYGELQQAVKAYAESKGEYGKRLEALQKLYEGVEGANIENELTADLIGDYLFTDSDFVNHLSTEKPGLFKRIFEEIKYLVKTVTAGGKQARELEKVKRVFEKAYRDAKASTDGVTKYSIVEPFTDSTGKKFKEAVLFDTDFFDGSSPRNWGEKLKEFVESRSANNPVIMLITDENGEPVVLQFAKPNERVTKDGKSNHKVIDKLWSTSDNMSKLAVVHIDEVITTSEENLPYHTEENNHQWLDENGWLHRNANVINQRNGNIYNLKIDIAKTADGRNILYATDGKINRVGNVNVDSLKIKGLRQNSNSEIIVAEEEQKVKHSVSDSSGRQLSKGQREYFKASGNAQYSLGADIAPIGNYNVRGKDIALGPIREDVAPVQQSIPVMENIGPVSWEKVAERFAMEYDAWDKKNPTKVFKVANTSDAMKSIGVEDKVITMDSSKLIKILSKHEGMTDDFIKRIPNVIHDPMLIVVSKTNPSRIVMMGELTDAKGKTVLAVLELNPTSRKGIALDEIKIASTYGKDNLQSFVDTSKILYVNPNKQKTSSWITSTGLQLPVESLTTGSTNSIPQIEENASGDKENAPVEQAKESNEKLTRKDLHANIIDNISDVYAEKGYNFDDVLSNAKNLSTFRTVDNTPQRVMEKALGYKEGQILSDLTVNQVAQNETEGIKWLNSFTDRKNGFLAKISKEYGIKSHSKESAAAQMYAEGFWVNDKNEILEYGDKELELDFPDVKVRENIKALAHDPRIRQVYDETLKRINEARTRNAYPEIPRLENYFLHFRAMNDTFSRLGIPFNPNDIKAKDLPTDLNGVTADLKPGKPYFASEQHRKGKRTDFDLLGGLEQYLTAAKNQIYHIDDIQTLRALRNHIAERYGQASGLENLDSISEEELQERISQVYGSHLSTFAKFLNEEANILAGKTALIDRGLEGIIGRRGITFLNEVNKQVGANMVGFNLSSAGTNFLPVVQALAKMKKPAFVKALAQTAADKVNSIFGREGDGFAEKSPVIIRRKGAERFYRTPYQKIGDAGYVLMSAVDDISTEVIARAKYNELIAGGMDSDKAHYETDKWVSRLMGDRSLGQMPQLYNSKMLGLVTKFQLEVRNQLDSQFYDTIQEAKVSTEEIENKLLRNTKKAAKIGSTFFQLAVLQHLFGKAYESVAGYNPTFDIVEAIVKLFGWDDEEDSEDTVLDNIEEGFLTLLEDLPYAGTFTGGRIPISSALPIEELLTGVDEYGNEKSRLETLGEVAPYYVLPGGYGQIKKTYQGLKMFDDDLPIAGSYTDSGNLRFAVEDTPANRLQAGIFGQWASENARDYFDNERDTLKEKQIQELVDTELPMADYWKYRDGLKEQDSTQEKIEYIAGLDLPIATKNTLVNNAVQRETSIDLTEYDNLSGYEEFDFFSKNKELYSFLQENGVSYWDYKILGEEVQKEYKSLQKDSRKQKFLKENGVSVSTYCSFSEWEKDAYDWAYKNPEMYRLSRIITKDVAEYKRFTAAINNLEADREVAGKTITGSKKKKVIKYINSLDIDYGQKLILFRSEYNQDDSYNYEIVEYLNEREDITRSEMESILKTLGFTVYPDGRVTW